MVEDLAPNKWHALRGKSPTKRELAVWTQEHWMSFLQFCKVFIVTDEDGKSKMSVTKARWREVEGFLDMPGHPFQEFLYRIDKFVEDPMATEKKFFWKLSSMMKYALGYLRANPSLISPTMRDFIAPEPRLNWCLEQTKEVETAVGTVLVPRTDRPVGVVHDNVMNISPEKRLLDASIKATDLLMKLMEQVDARPEELKKMPLKDILMAIGRMSYVFSVGKNVKVGKGIFKQININASSREELESAMLQLNKDE